MCDAAAAVTATAEYLQHFSYDVYILYGCAVFDDVNDNTDSCNVNHFRFLYFVSGYCYLANFQRVLYCYCVFVIALMLFAG